MSDGQKALLYLRRYLYRSVIREADILRCDAPANITFQFLHVKTDKLAQRTLPDADFLWLVLQHVLPRGLRFSRNFGLLHPTAPVSSGCCRCCARWPRQAAKRGPRPSARPVDAPAANPCMQNGGEC